jgi:dipeptidyl aminopeptidase/acylaminoacyl peptidase
MSMSFIDVAIKRAILSISIGVVLASIFLFSPETRAQDKAQDTSSTSDVIVSQQAYTVPPFEKSGFPQSADIRDYYENTIRPHFNKIALKSSFTDLTYLSDGLKVKGFIIVPKNVSPKTKLPILVFNHGGNRDYGKLTVKDLFWLNKFAERGYLVVASQYRGVDGGEGSDEFGGRDVDDVRTLARLAKTLPHSDPERLYVVGHSRGGMMTYLTLKDSHEFNAAAVLAGECDLRKGLEIWPDFEKDVYEQVIPDYTNKKDEALTARSACSWAEKITTPVFIMQGDQDKNVAPFQASMMAAKLKTSGQAVKLEMIPGADHGWYFQNPNSDAVISKIDRWFSKHRHRAAHSTKIS